MQIIKRSCLLLTIITIGLSIFANPFYSDNDTNTPSQPRQGTARFISAQIHFREQISDTFTKFLDNPGIIPLLTILAFSFLYGILHAAGPGHRKTIIFSLFLSKKNRAWEPLAAGFLSAGIHAGAGAFILALLSIIRKAVASLSKTEVTIIWLDGITICIILLISLFLIIYFLIRHNNNDSEKDGLHGGNIYSILAISSMVPCPGAIMVMMFALYLHVPLLGIASFFAMSLGMGTIVSAFAYLAWFGREAFFSSLKKREGLLKKLSSIFEISSYIIIFIFSFITAWPFLISLF